MSVTAAKKQIGLGLVLVLSVSLLTLLFSFLGTIACAALVGMMIGTHPGRQSLAQQALLSAVFPLVMLTFLLGWKTDFTRRESVVLCLICFACFWVMCLLTRLAVHFEHQNATAAVDDALPLPDRASSPLAPEIQELQGKWCRQLTAADGQSWTKVLQVDREQTALSIIAPDGQVQCLCQGQLTVERLGAYRVLVLPRSPSQLGPAAANGDGVAAWSALYQLSGQVLTLAANLEASARQHPPELESYCRTPPHQIHSPVAPKS